ncbi:MAG: hypothetical protein Q8K70_08150 [Bacteroidota bacterium]|nr:hypothetical protein [Bacteroidota bacterium]
MLICNSTKSITLRFRLIIVSVLLVINGCKVHKQIVESKELFFQEDVSLNNSKSLLSEKHRLILDDKNDSIDVSNFLEKHSPTEIKKIYFKMETENSYDSMIAIKQNLGISKVDGKVRDLRVLFVYLGIGLFVLALVFLVFAIIKWHYIYLLGTAISSGASYLLLKLGKKKLKGKLVILDKKAIKQLKKWALRLFLVSLAVYLFLGLFY